jgi:UDPglucose 6-dehydrogenase
VLAEGGAIMAHDPKAGAEARRRYGDRIRTVEHRHDALDGADALVVLTEWQEYRVLDEAQLLKRMRGRVVIDARGLYEPARMRAAGFAYDAIGRR